VNDRIDERYSYLIVSAMGVARAVQFFGDRATAVDLVNEELAKHRLELREVPPLAQDVAKP
jgi:hypothetical protein